MSSNTAPYATVHDPPKFEKRTADVRAPWFKEQAAVKNVRSQVPLPHVVCNYKTSPYALHDAPKPAELSSPSPGTSGNQDLPPTNGSQLPQERKTSRAPYGTSSDVVLPRTKLNLAKVHQAPWDRSDGKRDHKPSQPNVSKVCQAPWDRNEVKFKVQPRAVPHGPSTLAPYATDSKV